MSAINQNKKVLVQREEKMGRLWQPRYNIWIRSEQYMTLRLQWTAEGYNKRNKEELSNWIVLGDDKIIERNLDHIKMVMHLT